MQRRGPGGPYASALPRSARRFRKAPRRARSPALHCGRKRAATRKRQPFLKPDGGPMQASAPTQGAGGGREDAAARKGLAPVFRRVCGGRESVAIWKGICRARCGTPPSPAATPPLAGEASGAAATQKGSPARGAGCAGRRRLRGALPVGDGDTPQGLAGPCPMFLRGRCSHLSRKPCGGPLFPVLPPVCLIL